MKKNLFLAVALFVGAIGFTACSSDSDDSNKLPDTSTLSGATTLEFESSIYYNGFNSPLQLTGFAATPKTNNEGTAMLQYTRYIPPRAKEMKAYVPAVHYQIYAYTYRDGVYTIAGFGTVTVKKENGQLKLSIKPDGATEETVTATAVTPTVNDPVSKSLYRSWIVAKTEFTYTEINSDGTEKKAVGAQFAHADLVKMGEWLLQNENVDIRRQLGSRGGIERIIFDMNGLFIIHFTGNNGYNATVNVAQMKWVKQGKEFDFSWLDEELMGNNNFENGQGTITVDNGTGIATLGLAGDITQNANNGTRYKGALTLTLKPE